RPARGGGRADGGGDLRGGRRRARGAAPAGPGDVGGPAIARPDRGPQGGDRGKRIMNGAPVLLVLALAVLRISVPYVMAALGGMGAGLLAAALYALLVVVLRGDQVVCGVGMFLLSDGLSRFLLKVVFDSTSNSPRLPALDGRYAPLFIGAAALLPLLLGRMFSD